MNDSPYRMERLGTLMRPDPDDPYEAWGVLNPASVRVGDDLYLFPRLVAEGNRSRVGRALVRFDERGDPVGVERLGVVLEPEESWENNETTGGVEDPRITCLDALGVHVMTYSAYGPLGPRVALAVSEDLVHWERLGPVSFAYDPALRADLNLYPNKDAVLFPEPVPDPDGTPSFAMLHRPMWDLSWVRPDAGEPLPATITDHRPGIWVSFAAVDEVAGDVRRLPRFTRHHLVALSEQPWEELKIGGGTPPVRVPEGWLSVYHGVAGEMVHGEDLQQRVRYAAGLLVLDAEDVTKITYRSTDPMLEPETDEERDGIVPNVVFPTAIDPRDDDRIDVYYGMADSRIGVARLLRNAPESAPPQTRPSERPAR